MPQNCELFWETPQTIYRLAQRVNLGPCLGEIVVISDFAARFLSNNQ